jgi:hypothetical protein
MRKEILQWVIGDDTGISSKTIWAVMTGAVTKKDVEDFPRPARHLFDVPHDPDDFGRCYRLLKIAPEWRVRLNEMYGIFPEWELMAKYWNAMEKLWEEESPRRRCPKLYDLMQTLIEDKPGVLRIKL